MGSGNIVYKKVVDHENSENNDMNMDLVEVVELQAQADHKILPTKMPSNKTD